jgi:hypothetical protein
LRNNSSGVQKEPVSKEKARERSPIEVIGDLLHGKSET